MPTKDKTLLDATNKFNKRRPTVNYDTIWRTPTHGRWYEDNPTYLDGYDDTGDWLFSTPEKQGMDSKSIKRGIAELERNRNLFSILIVKNGVLVHEQYFNGCRATHSNNIHSVSKSMLSALVGIAVEEGYIESIGQEISEIAPEYFTPYAADDPRREITLWHLMTMTTGLDWVEDEYEYEFNSHDDWVREILVLDMLHLPGVQFHYSSGVTHLTSAIITKATGMSTCEFAHTHLFEPLNINAEHWGKDPQGIFCGGYNLYLTAREMARFGLLYLRDGKLEGRKILPRWLVEESLSAHASEDDTYDYGYFWWKRKLDGYDVSIAWGWGGQFIYVIPELDLMYVSTTKTSGKACDKEVNAERLLVKFVIPSINELT